jgi:hypothetical protein
MQDPTGRTGSEVVSADSPDEDMFELHLPKHYTDHFTLPAPSSTVRFRSKYSAARVFENKTTQFVLEETYDPVTTKRKINVKRMKDTTKGLQFLRATYTIVCILWTGFFFVFALQVLLFLVLDLVIEAGSTTINTKLNVGKTIGVFLAMIVFIQAFASALVIASHYCSDTWGGHYLVKQFFFSKFNEVTLDWIFFSFFVLIPLLVMCITLLTKMDGWWEVTSLVWFSCVLVFFAIFATNSVVYEVSAAIICVKNQYGGTWVEIMKRCILLRQRRSYSGRRLVTYLARSLLTHAEEVDQIENTDIYESTRREQLTWWSNITSWKYLSTDDEARGLHLYKTLNPPVKLFTLDDVQENRPYVTKYTWSLERVFCRPANSRYIAIVSGPGALTKAQLRSSLVCSFIGTGLMLLLLVSILVWMSIPGGFIAIIFLVALIMAWGSLKSTFRLLTISKDLFGVKKEIKIESIRALEALQSSRQVAGSIEEIPDQAEGHGEMIGQTEEKFDEGEGRDTLAETSAILFGSKASRARSLSRRDSEYMDVPNEGIFIVVRYHRITEVTERFCWILFSLEISVLFVYPAVTLFILGNWPVGLLFLFVASISGIRYYINAICVIEEAGTMDIIGGASVQERWKNKARLSDIIGSITDDKSHSIWIAVLTVFAFIWVGIFLSGIGDSNQSQFDTEFTYLPNFYYTPKTIDMRYPTCTLNNAIKEFDENATMLDYAFLTILPYKPRELIQSDLDNWFTDIEAVNDEETVSEFRTRTRSDQSAVVFNLFRFKNPEKETAVIAIRGTHTKYDLLADSQLWSAAILMQVLRGILPIGDMWTPILDGKSAGSLNSLILHS